MKNSIGNNFRITIFGESHQEAIGVVIDGLAAGISLDFDLINRMMSQRKAKGKISTQRHEADEVHLISGFFNGYTTGTPLTILIQNSAQHSKDYSQLKSRLRPGHADYTAYEKYEGYQDYRGGGHFSGRITAPLVCAGAIAMQILNQKGIKIGSHIKQLHHLEDLSFSEDEALLNKQIDMVNQMDFAVLDEDKKEAMTSFIEACAKQKDSCGGILETAIINLPTGLGEPFFDSIESKLAHLLFSVPAVKGVSFGLGFDFSKHYGSEVNDPLYYDEETQQVKTKTNCNGGINGGISNGMPIKIHTVIKPTPSIYKKQASIDASTHEAVELEIQGRHDPAIIHRARIVIDSVVAIGLLDLYLERQATLSMKE